MTSHQQISRSLPAAKTEPAKSLAVPTGTGQAGGTFSRKSNFDLTGVKLVKRGVSVSWHGICFKISKVRLGTCYPDSSLRMYVKFFDCNEVRVVA